MDWNSIVEARIREARERGEFEGLTGAGKPIPDLDQPHDEFWWLKKWMRREGLRPQQELREVLAERREGRVAAEVRHVYESRDGKTDAPRR